MFRSLAFGCFRRVGQSYRANICAGVKNNCSHVRSCRLYKANTKPYCTSAQRLFFVPRSYTMVHHAKKGWKMTSKTTSLLKMMAGSIAGPILKEASIYRPWSRLTLSLIWSSPILFWGSRYFTTDVSSMFHSDSSNVGIPLIVSTPQSSCYLPFFLLALSPVHTLRAYLSSFISSLGEHFLPFTRAISEPFLLFTRAIYLAILFSPSIAMLPFVETFGLQLRNTWIELVVGSLKKAGPVFVALGQWAATRLDLFPRDLCIQLSTLSSKATEHSFAYTKKSVEKAFCRSLTEIFDDFEEAPVESSHVAQVHRAKLRCRYPGKQVKPVVVAVKVRHPSIKESSKRDIQIIQNFAKLVNFIPSFKWLRLQERLRNFEEIMTSQIDLCKEAMMLSRFSNHFRHWADVSFREPLFPLVHSTVLVETYEEDPFLSHYIENATEVADIKDDLVHVGTRALTKMFMVEKFVHAGMRPENITVKSRKWNPHIAFHDVTMTAKFSFDEVCDLVQLVYSLSKGHGRTAAEYTLSLSKKKDCPDPNAFIEDVQKSFKFWNTREGGRVPPVECMQRLLEKAHQHKVNIDDNASIALTSILALESWQRKVYSRSIFRFMYNFF